MASKLVFLHHHALGKVLCCKYNLAQELPEHFMGFYSLRNWGSSVLQHQHNNDVLVLSYRFTKALLNKIQSTQMLGMEVCAGCFFPLEGGDESSPSELWPRRHLRAEPHFPLLRMCGNETVDSKNWWMFCYGRKISKYIGSKIKKIIII